MDAPLFTSFGLLLLLMMRKPKPRLQIAHQFDLCIQALSSPTALYEHPER